MTKEELAEIRERVELTPIGKWWWTPSSLEGNENEAQLLWVARDLHDNLYIGAQEEVAEFIPHAREDIPKLLDEIERLQVDRKSMLRIALDALNEEIHRCADFGMWPGVKDFEIALKDAFEGEASEPS